LCINAVACCACDLGDIILGLNPVDSHWWHATLSGETGIIPLTHVIELHSADDVRLCNLWSAAAAASVDDLKSSVTSALVGSTVIADNDLTAQLDHELTFYRGDVIYVLEDLGDGFAIGECNGAVGQFPLYFCTPTDPQAVGSIPSPEMPPCINAVAPASSPSWKRCHSRPSSYTLANTRSQDCSVIPYCSTLYEFAARAPSELSFGVGQIIHLISHLDDDWCFGELDGKCGAFPTSYVDIIVDCDAASSDQVQPSLVTETQDAVPEESETLFSDQHASCSSNTAANVTEITQTSFSDQQANCSGKTTAAVPVVRQTSFSSQEGSWGGNTTDLYGRVICDFFAVNVNEIDASEGETVTVLQRLDHDWLEVRHDNGKVGLCPASYVELFGAEPEPTVKPDVRTSSAVKPKLPVKPKLSTTAKSCGISSGSAPVDQSKKFPVSDNLPVLSTQPVRTQPDQNTFLPSTSNTLSSPMTEAPKAMPYATTTTMTNSFSTSGQPVLHGPSLDELIQAQLTSAKSTSMTATNGTDNKPYSQKITSDRPIGTTLNGIADVVGQSSWYALSATPPVSTVSVPSKPPPPRRPAPARPTQPSAASLTLPAHGSKNNVEGVNASAAQKKAFSNLIDFSPDHNPSKTGIQCVTWFIYLYK